MIKRNQLSQWINQRNRTPPRGATRLGVDRTERAAQSPRRWTTGHVTLVAVVGAVLGVFTLLNSGNQEAATLPLSESAQPATMAATTSPTSEALSPATEHTTVVTDMLETLPEPAPAPLWREETVRSGDNLSLIFARAGFNDSDVYRVTQAEGGKALRKIFPGETIGFLVNPDTGALEGVRHSPSRLLTTLFTLGPDGDFEREVITQEPEVRTRGVTMTIESSLFVAGQSAGLSGPVIMELANIFGGVIDFVLDPRQGDTIEVVYEEHFLEGEKLTDGNIIAASFTNRGETFAAFRYSDNDGHTSYYNEQGVSMRKAFLMAPVDFTRISSNFNPNRLHPIYKTKRPHRGTDYAAPTGTPVYAAGDGRVVEAGYNGANGNYVFIQHGEGFKTHYLHLHKRKVQKGQKVDQGDIIGTVGATGSATGPHLHYEFLVNGVHRNPRTVHKLLPKAKSLSEFELPRYKEAIAEPMAQLAALRQETRLALAEQ